MAASFFFYDLETSGINPRTARIMQFAGQRTDMDFMPIGKPVDTLIALAPDILPDPEAILITGITPQQSIAEGITEAAFLKTFSHEIALPGTIFVGYNSVRFDDEFMRFLLYRNFYDPYTWEWAEGRSRWDLLDVVRMTRALRPRGISWPMSEAGKPSNKLVDITAANGLLHEKAHDAFSDVTATIAVAQLIAAKQPKLFRYLLSMRDKKAVQQLVEAGRPFVYSSGKYHSANLCTTVVSLVCLSPTPGSALVYDLRFDPTPYLDMTPEQLVAIWHYTKDPEAQRLPIKTLKYNRCPAVAPRGVLAGAETTLEINLEQISKNAALLEAHKEPFSRKVLRAVELMDESRNQHELDKVTLPKAEEQLYDSFIERSDSAVMMQLVASDPTALAQFQQKLKDSRLQAILPHYRARNYPMTLSAEEHQEWEAYCHEVLFGGGNKSRFGEYLNQIKTTGETRQLNDSARYILEELRLYGESIAPLDT